MIGDRTLPRELEVARQSLVGLDGVDVLREFEWHPETKTWVLLCRLSIRTSGNSPVPARTSWYVLVGGAYPWGPIQIFPAKHGGLEDTYPHQNLNLPGPDCESWRTGKICVDTGVHALGRGFDVEPFDAHLRIRWRIQRALEWLQAADRGELMRPGEPFELPDYDPQTASILAFWEDASSFARWANVRHESGLVQIAHLGADGEVAVVRMFQTAKGEDLIVPLWGKHVSDHPQAGELGLWIRLSDVPHLKPWKAPVSWGELRQLQTSADAAVLDVLRDLLPAIRDGKRHYLLLGFPIPERVADEPGILFWLPIRLPVLSRAKRNGFRPGAAAGWANDRASIFRADAKIEWIRSENWSPADLAGRGRFPAGVTRRRYLAIGGGALGAFISEMLIRGGATTMAVSDDDTVGAGNLVRHVLTLDDVGTGKNVAVARRLNAASPHAVVTAIAKFPPAAEADTAAVHEADVVLDFTGSEAAAGALGAYLWGGEKVFLSLSVGLNGKRVYCFAAFGNRFPNEEFVAALQPWLQRQIIEADGMELPREGVGCWHPVFPARVDDLWLLGAAAVKWIERYVIAPPAAPELVVFEQVYDAEGFGGIRRLRGSALDE